MLIRNKCAEYSRTCRRIKDSRMAAHEFPIGKGNGYIFQMNQNQLCICSAMLAQNSRHCHRNNGILVLGIQKRVYISCLKNTCRENMRANWQRCKKEQAMAIREAVRTASKKTPLRDIFPSAGGDTRIWVELLPEDIKH